MHAVISAGLDGWGLYIAPNAPSIPAWNDPEAITLIGFPTFWDAWAFCVANCGYDTTAGLPQATRIATLRPPPDAGRAPPPHQPRLL